LNPYTQDMVTRTLQLPDDVDAVFEREAKETGRTVNEVIVEALRRVEEERKYLAALDEGIAEADRGDVVNGDDLFRSVRAKLEGMRAAR
jgi:predicted transcriptional regulator